VIAGQDTNVYLYDNATPGNGGEGEGEEPVRILKGHSDNVCVVSVGGTSEKPVIVSGSWDKTAKVWNLDGDCLYTLSGHQYAVWGAAMMETGDVFTGEASLFLCLFVFLAEVSLVLRCSLGG